jgi:uncharacterized membrane-anchored protein YhcB (DUF1043 family)
VEKAYGEIANQGLLGALLLVVGSIVVYFYNRIEQNNRELRDEFKEERKDDQREIGSLREKMERYYSEDRLFMQRIIQDTTLAFQTNSKALEAHSIAILEMTKAINLFNERNKNG